MILASELRFREESTVTTRETRTEPDASRATPSAESALWSRAFRPFFLGGAVYAAASVVVWTSIWAGDLPPPGWLVPAWWHGHEMVFGFVGAAITGFLLTAAPVWTGRRALAGRPLAALFALWVAGRVAFLVGGVAPIWLVGAIDVAFLPAVAVVLGTTLRGADHYRNHGILLVVLALGAGNVAMHASALGFIPMDLAGRALRASVGLVVVLLLVVGGRITPAFTANAIKRQGLVPRVRSHPWLDGVAIGAVGLLAVTDLLVPRSHWSGALAIIAGVAASARLLGWQGWTVRNEPLLWSLHAGMGWVAVGLILVGLGDLDASVPDTAGLHALTVGAMGTTILAVMTRVGLGHTGRLLVLPAWGVASYALVHAAAVLRVSAAFGPPAAQPAILWLSALAWASAFSLFVGLYWGILTRPRPDGLPG